MYTFHRPWCWALLAVLAALGPATPASWAQRQMGIQPFRVMPGPNVPALGLSTSFRGPGLPPYSLGGNPLMSAYPSAYANPAGAAANPYASYGQNAGSGSGGYGQYYESELGGYLRGAADLLNSEGRLQTSVQQANLLRQSVYRERLENHRRWIEEWKYWHDALPTAEDDRQKAVALQVHRSLNDPPVGEIYSGQALNTILNDLQKKATKDSDFRAAPTITLDPDTLRHLNFTGQEGKGNPGLLRNKGRLSWPAPLQSAPYQAEREVLNELTPAVYDQAVDGKVDARSLQRMTQAVRSLRARLTEDIRDLTPAQYAEARRFLGDLDDGLALLRQPGAGEVLGAKVARRKEIAELVQDLTSKGLRFAPATPGDEPAYRAVHRALVAYDLATRAQLKAER